jgi:hypothetical protein
MQSDHLVLDRSTDDDDLYANVRQYSLGQID